MKRCTKCCALKPLSEFFRDRAKRHGYMAQCKVCKKAAFKKWKAKKPDFDRRRYWGNRDYERERHLIRKYGVTFETYRRLLEVQHGQCAICGRPEPSNRMLDVDHDHATGRVRGLLCTSCNRVLGHAQDSASRLRRAADYLDTPIVPQLAAVFIQASIAAREGSD